MVRASLVSGAPEVIGQLEARVRPEVHAGASPVRWMVVGESRNGFVLRGPGVTPFDPARAVRGAGAAAVRTAGDRE